MNQDNDASRRQVLKGVAAAGAATALGPFFPGRVLGANDRVTMAVIGIRNQGFVHIDNFAKAPNVRLKTLCDVDENLFAERLKAVQDKHGYRPGTESDMRRVLDDKDIDAVSIATPDHWHALAAIWGAQAKKHVYVEKPCSHTLWEGRQMVRAARKYNILMQVGFNSRTNPVVRSAMKFLHAGKLGKIHMVRGLCFNPRGNIGRYPDGPMPEGPNFPFTIAGLAGGTNQNTGHDRYTGTPRGTKSYLEKVHYDAWLGPAPLRPFNPNRFHYNWHWQWAYGSGDTGNQGPHEFDKGRWGLNKDEAPVRVRSIGGVYVYTDSQQETPNIQSTTFEYADGTIFEFTTRGLPTNAEGGLKVGNIFYGSEGRLELGGDGWKTFMGAKGEPGPDSTAMKEPEPSGPDYAGERASGHFGNFVDAVRAGNPEKLHAEIEVGFRSCVLPIIANISYRLKRELKFDGDKEQFMGDAEANRMLTREYRKGYAVPKMPA